MSTISSSKTIPVAKPSLRGEEERAVVEALRSGWVSQGPKVVEFESAFGEYVDAPCAVAVSSCTTALHLALVALGIEPGDEVLCPSLSFVATANAIMHVRAFPVFVDVDFATYNMDPNCTESAITPRTRAILLVHQVGLPAALDEICEIARRHRLMVIEDAACAIGSQYHGQRIGRPHGAVACFSFHPRKVLTTGEGGMITTCDEKLAARMRRLRQHGMSMSDLARHGSRKVAIETYDEVGFNYRMTDLQAALGCVQLHRLTDMLETRRALAARYTKRLATVPWLVPPQEPTGLRHNYQSYMVRLTSDAPIGRDELMQRLLDRGVATRRGIMAIHREAPYRGVWDRQLPVTNAVTDTTIILPLFNDMSEEDLDYVVECIEEIGR